MRTLIRNGRVLDSIHECRTADVAIADGKIVAIGPIPADFNPDHTIEANNAIVMAGIVDLAARLREPGYEYMATLESELNAAAAGGITSLCIPPDTDPPLDEPGLVEMLKHRARQINSAHVHPIGALTMGLQGQYLTEMAELHEAGCIAFSHADAALIDTQVLLRAMQYARTFDLSVWLRPQEFYLSRDGLVHDGDIASRLGLSGIPVQAEIIALQTYIELVRLVGVRLHVCRLSSATGVELVRQAQQDGLPITADVAIHHVHLCDRDILSFETNARVTPPLRSDQDRQALREGLRDGTIAAICSDHTPVDDDQKQLPFADAESGVTGLELLLPLTLKWAQEARIPLSQALACITHNPAKIMGNDQIGRLTPGANADICIVDPDTWRVVHTDQLISQGKNTPFLNIELPGVVCYTLFGGQVVYPISAQK